MVKLCWEASESLLAKALIDAQEQEVSLNAFISEAVNAALTNPASVPARKAVNVDELIIAAVERARAQKIGAEFMLVDVCTGEDWDALSGGERKSLGKGFRKAVEGMTPPVAEYVRRTSSNKAVYKRV